MKLMTLYELKEWLEVQIEDTKQEIALEIGEGCFKSMGKLQAYQKVLELLGKY